MNTRVMLISKPALPLLVWQPAPERVSLAGWRRLDCDPLTASIWSVTALQNVTVTAVDVQLVWM